jgi:hypothetical protein
MKGLLFEGLELSIREDNARGALALHPKTRRTRRSIHECRKRRACWVGWEGLMQTLPPKNPFGAPPPACTARFASSSPLARTVVLRSFRPACWTSATTVRPRLAPSRLDAWRWFVMRSDDVLGRTAGADAERRTLRRAPKRAGAVRNERRRARGRASLRLSSLHTQRLQKPS